jgi:hypothetical protein
VLDIVGNVQMIPLGLELHDGDARLEVCRLDVHHKPGPEAAAQALFDAAQLLGRPVARDHDLSLVLVQVIERVEELGLCLLGPGQELDVVEQEDVHVPILPLKDVSASLPDGLDELGHEGLRGDVADPGARGQGPHVIGDGEEKVRLAEADASVDEDRVVGLRWRGFGYRQGSSVRELVAGSGDERVERVAVREGGVMPEGVVESGLVGIHLLRAGPPASRRSAATRVLGCRPSTGGVGGWLLVTLRLQLQSDRGGSPKGLLCGPGDQVHVVGCEPGLHVGAGRDQFEDVPLELTRHEVGEPQVVRSLREFPPGALDDGCPSCP